MHVVAVTQEVTQRVEMGVAAREAESYEDLRATIDRRNEEIRQLLAIVKNERRVRDNLENVIRDQRQEIMQYQAIVDSALAELFNAL